MKLLSYDLADSVYFNTHDNFEDKNTWMTVKIEFFKAFTLQACSDAIISLTEGTCSNRFFLNNCRFFLGFLVYCYWIIKWLFFCHFDRYSHLEIITYLILYLQFCDDTFEYVLVVGDYAEYAIIFGYQADPNTLAINRTDSTPLVVGPLSGRL